MSLSTESPPPFAFLLMGRGSVTYAVIINENTYVISIAYWRFCEGSNGLIEVMGMGGFSSVSKRRKIGRAHV